MFRGIMIGGIITLMSGTAFGYSGGTGEPNNPYQIADKNDLLALAADTNDYDKCFIFNADVNMQNQVFTTAIIAADTSSSSGFQGTAFTGIFDGNGHSISNFIINGSSNRYVGLFGNIDIGGSVMNLGIENCDINSPDNGSGYTGSIAGYNSGNINNCYSTGSVYGRYDVGGLIGYNNGIVNNCYSTSVVAVVDIGQFVGGLIGLNDGNISDCYSTGTVEGGNNNGGGLVAYNNGIINNCYSTGAVGGDYLSDDFGGLVGCNAGNVSNCYSTGTVYGYRIGGFAGFNSSGSITNCYSTGLVTCSNPLYGTYGGLVGANSSGTITASFWDTETSGLANSAGGEGKTTAEMKKLSTFTFAEWDFAEVWGIGNGQSYPYLKSFNGINPADIDYSGTVDLIDLATLAESWLEGVAP